MRKVCIVTGTRAEWGLLSRLAGLIKDDPELQLQIVATNMHLSPEFGLTYREIEQDGFTVDRKVEMLLSSDTPSGTTKSTGLALIGFADAYAQLQPDILVVIGDRFEMLAAATAALFFKIPVAHISGGDVTEGAYDDAIRHSITKMSHLHFASTDEYRNRVIQLGETPERVFNVGAIGLDNIKHLSLLGREEVEESLSFKLGEKTMLVTYHPVTLEENGMMPEEQINSLLDALAQYKDYKIIFTLPNSDTGGRIITERIQKFADKNKENTAVYTSLGHLRYLSVLQYVSLVVGNSSSGILEVPSFGIPTVNIGNRQKGRLQGNSIINCGNGKEEIKGAIDKAIKFSDEKHDVTNPYEVPGTAEAILGKLKNTNLEGLVNKKFYDIR